MSYTVTFVDPHDRPLDAMAWGRLVEQLTPVHVIALRCIKTPVGEVYVRTTWSGAFAEGVCQPFATATATGPDGPWTEVEGYRTRAAALAGHQTWTP